MSGTEPRAMEPPYYAPPVRDDQTSQAWMEFFQSLIDRLTALEARVKALEPP
jgi:hypothetical protein